jgi:hypothetical protein
MGSAWCRAREARFERTYGFRSNGLPGASYLIDQRFAQLAEGLRLEWQRIAPSCSWRLTLRPWTARLLRHREPTLFLLVAGRLKGP